MKWDGGYPHQGLVVRIHLELFAESLAILSPQEMWLLFLLRASHVSVPMLGPGQLQERSQRRSDLTSASKEHPVS